MRSKVLEIAYVPLSTSHTLTRCPYSNKTCSGYYHRTLLLRTSPESFGGG